MKFSVITALSLSALTLAAPVDQGAPEYRIANVDAADASSADAQFPWPRLFGGKSKKSSKAAQFAIAKAAFIGAKLGAASGTRFTGAKAFLGAKYGALRGVKGGFRRLGRGRRGGFGPKPFGGGFGRGFPPRPFGGKGFGGGFGGKGFGKGFGKGYGGGFGKGFGPGFGPGFGHGFRRDAQTDLQGPDAMIGQDYEQPQWTNYAEEAQDDQYGQEGEEGEEYEGAEEFQPQEQQQFDASTIDEQISRALADVEAPAEAEAEAAPESEASPAPAEIPAETPAAA